MSQINQSQIQKGQKMEQNKNISSSGAGGGGGAGGSSGNKSGGQSELVKCLGGFFQRDLISVPLIKKYPHQAIQQRGNLRAATLELDSAAYPNIEYIAGNRLSIYAANPMDHVLAIMKHLVDDISQQPHYKPVGSTTSATGAAANVTKRMKLSDPWSKFVQLYGKNSVKMALLHVYDIMVAPSRDLLRIMAENCTNKEHKNKLIALSKGDDVWERWVCASLRTLRSTLDEFSSCSISARALFSELHLQQPRQYSISSIKSSKRFRIEIIVFQHKFTPKQIANTLETVKERERIQQQEGRQQGSGANEVQHPTMMHVNHQPDNSSTKSNKSLRSLRSVATFGPSPITSQQVKRVPSFSGPLMSQYATSNVANNQSSIGANGKSGSSRASRSQLSQQNADNAAAASSSGSSGKLYDGLCSNYLLNLQPNEQIVCEFVENPRFTLKGNRERPIMMLGQDVGVVAFRPFWQQRALEHDRAQVFYTLFKDLSPKKFGDMQLVCLTGNRCRVEDLFKREINSMVTNKILSSATYINKANLLSLIERAATTTAQQTTATNASKQPQTASAKQITLEPKELVELGQRISKLLVDQNGCLYTCCDPQMTQAIEILIVESISRNYKQLTRDRIMALLPKWKGRRMNEQPLINNKFLFTLENPFERAQIVQEIYDSTI